MMSAKVHYHDSEYTNQKRFKLRFTEWTFIFLLFAFSSSVLLGKLALYYEIDPNPIIHSSLSNKNLYLDSSRISTKMNASIIYHDLVNHKVVNILKEYYWFFKACFCGMATTAFTWFIIYKDSQIPGVNPPSPFSPRHKTNYRSESHSFMHINYFLGLIIGILIFLYMCF